jgi:hypothetical protein
MHKISGGTCKFVHERGDGETSRMMPIKDIKEYLGSWGAYLDMSPTLIGS